MNRIILFLFVGIVISFSWLAFYRINDQGLLYHDVGAYLLESKFLDESLDVLLTSDPEQYKRPDFWEEVKKNTSGVPLHMGKPGFNVIVAAVGALVGFRDALIAQVTAACALLSLFLTFLVARRLGNYLSAVYATAVLASSVFFLIYARSGFVEPVVTVCFLTAILLYLRSRSPSGGRVGYWVGFLLGYAFACNQWRVSYMLPILIFLDFVSTWKEQSPWNAFIRRVVFASLGFLTPIVAFQLPYLGAGAVAGPLPFEDYWSQLARRSRAFGGLLWFHGVGETGSSFWIVEGPLFVTLVLLAWSFLAVRLAVKKRFEDLLILCCSLVPFIFFSLMSWGGETLPRMMSGAIPFACIGVGFLMEAVHKGLQARWGLFQKGEAFLAAGLVAALLVSSLPRQASAGITRSGYLEASRYLESTGKKKFMILGMEPVFRFYLGRVAFEPYHRPQTLDELITVAKANGIEHVVVDFYTLHSKYGLDYTAALLAHETPVAVFPNPRGVSLPYLLDEFGLEKARSIARDSRSKDIYIFDLKNIQ